MKNIWHRFLSGMVFFMVYAAFFVLLDKIGLNLFSQKNPDTLTPAGMLFFIGAVIFFLLGFFLNKISKKLFAGMIVGHNIRLTSKGTDDIQKNGDKVINNPLVRLFYYLCVFVIIILFLLMLIYFIKSNI